MGVNWVWNNTLGPMVNLYSVSTKSGADAVAQMIVSSSEAAMQAIWFDNKANGQCSVDDVGVVKCGESFSSWIEGGFAAVDVADDYAWDFGWIERFNFLVVENGLVSEELFDYLNKPFGGLGGQIASIIEAHLGLGTQGQLMSYTTSYQSGNSSDSSSSCGGDQNHLYIEGSLGSSGTTTEA